MDGQNSVLSVVGPMSHSVATLRLLIRALLSQEPWLHDPLVHEIPWRHENEQQMIDLTNGSVCTRGNLAFGILRHDGSITPQPPVRRAMQTVTDTLKKLGHKVLLARRMWKSLAKVVQIIEWEPPSHRRGVDLCVRYPRHLHVGL